jgi:hypothetical protein
MNMDDKDAEIARLKQALENAVENALTACRAAYKKGLEDANLQVEAYRKAFEEIRQRGHQWMCPQSSDFRDGDCICDETWPDPVVKA